jgi:hypothetical protein
VFVDYYKNFKKLFGHFPTPVATRSKALVHGRSFAGTVGWNSAGAWLSVCVVVVGGKKGKGHPITGHEGPTGGVDV